MIPEVEPLYHRIAEALKKCIPEDWSTAKMEAIFYAGSSDYFGEYTRKVDGVARSTEGGISDLGKAIRELRAKFKEAEKPLWGYFRFEMNSDGKFNTHFGYENCDADGNALSEGAEEYSRRQRARHRRLTS